MSRMLMPYNRLRLSRLGSELTTNIVGVQPVDSADIVLVGFEPELLRFRFCFADLARSDSGNVRDRADWSSQMLPSRSEPGSLPIMYRILIIETDCQDRFCFGLLQRRERRIQLILPNVDQPNEARIGVVVLRPICGEWLQRAANNVR